MFKKITKTRSIIINRKYNVPRTKKLFLLSVLRIFLNKNYTFNWTTPVSKRTLFSKLTVVISKENQSCNITEYKLTKSSQMIEAKCILMFVKPKTLKYM